MVRLPAVLVPAVALALLALRPWRWDSSVWRAVERWAPSRRVTGGASAAIALTLAWIVLTRLQSGELNGVDFTVYFDRPCARTLQGRPLWVETADFPQFSHQSSFEHHAYWGMVPLCAVYALGASPLWLLGLSVVAVVAGAVHTLRIMQHLRAPGVLAAATALAFVLNDTTARTLNYGFHPEVLYAWFIPWLIDAGMRGRRGQFLAAVVASLLVKEDAVLPLFAACLALALHRRESPSPLPSAWLMFPVMLGLANLGAYYFIVLPAITARELPAYDYFWASYGPTPLRALAGMLAEPWRVALDSVQSGFLSRVILPHLLLPLVAWRWMLGTIPIVALYSASDDPQLRAFGIYYAMPLVPFLVTGASSGAFRLLRAVVPDTGKAALGSAALVAAGVVFIGSTDRGYSLRPWRTETAHATAAVAQLAGERTILVQSALYPHTGYDDRVQLLTGDTLRSPRYAGAAILLAPALGAYPLDRQDVARLMLLPPVRSLAGGLVAVRGPGRPHHGSDSPGARHGAESRHGASRHGDR